MRRLAIVILLMMIPGLWRPNMASATVAVYDLTCEYLQNPLGIDAVQPRLSWMLRSSKRGEIQTAYEVKVASSRKALAAGKGDLWDSGRAESEESTLVTYGGRSLRSGEQCWWKVRVWDREGQASAWSKPAFWSMGMLSPDHWEAQWIAVQANLPKDAEPSVQSVPSPLFRRTFEITKPVKSAYAYTCGLGFYELRLNGKKVGDEVLQPEFARYEKRALYVTKDVTDLLKAGANAVGVMLGNGWFNSQARDAWDFDKAPWRSTPRLLFQMRIEYADGTSETIGSDGSWRTAPGPIAMDSIRNGETYDARLERPGWDTPHYGDPGWKPAVVVEGPTTKLKARMMQPARVTGVIKPVKITEPKPGVFLFDFGQNMSGWCRLKVAAPAGTSVLVEYDERLADDGTIDRRQAGLVYSGRFQADTYIAKGDGVETWEPRFVYAGFRYAQVEGLPGKPSKDTLTACVVHTDFDTTSSFRCSNDLLNRIQGAARWSYLSNFVGYPTDCPHREKNGWTGDAQIAAEMGLFNFNPAAAYTKWMDDFDDAQTGEGDLPGIVPTTGWGYGVGPAWDSAYLLIPYYMYVYCGDQRILTSHYEGLKRYVDYLGRRAEGHIVRYGLGDWCPPEGAADSHDCPAALTSTAYYYVDALIVARTAGMLGKEEDARKYAELAEEIRKAFNAEFYDNKTGLYAGDCQTSQAAALYQGMVEPGQEEKVLAALLERIERSGGRPDGGILGTKYVLHALTDRGRADVAYRFATQREFPGWGHWIDQGATTLWETWNGEGSRNHIMFGDISAWFYKAIAGIRPDPEKPGFKHVVIRPHPVGDLKWAKAEHQSMYGMVRSSWSKEDDGLVLEVEVPANTSATVYVPGGSPDGIAEGGKPLRHSPGVVVDGTDDGCTVVKVGSGRYRFEVGG